MLLIALNTLILTMKVNCLGSDKGAAIFGIIIGRASANLTLMFSVPQHIEIRFVSAANHSCTLQGRTDGINELGSLSKDDGNGNDDARKHWSDWLNEEI